MPPAVPAQVSGANELITTSSARPATMMSQPVLLGGLASATPSHGYHLAGILFNAQGSSNLCSVDFAAKINGGQTSLSQLQSVELDLNGFVTTVECRVDETAHDITLGGHWAAAHAITADYATQTLAAADTDIRCSGETLHTPDNVFPLKLKASAAKLRHLQVKTGTMVFKHGARMHKCTALPAKIRILLKTLRLRRTKVQFRSLTGAGGSKRKANDSDLPDIESSKSAKAQKIGSDGKKGAAKKKKKQPSGGDGDGDGDDSDPDDDGPGGDPAPKAGKEPRQRVRKLEAKQKVKVPDSEKDDEIARLATTLTQTSDAGLRNTQRIAEYMKSVKVRRIVKAVIPEENEAPLDAYLQAPNRPGRAVSAKSWSKTASKSHWTFYFQDDGTEKVFKTKKNPSLTVDFKILPKETASNMLDQIHAELTRFLNTWPWTYTNNQRSMPTPLWISRILTNIQSRDPEIQNVGLHGPLYSIKIKYIDPESGAMETKTCRISPSDVTMAPVQLPTLPPLILVEFGADATTKDVTHYIGPTKLDASQTSTASQHKAQDALKWIALQLQGLVASDTRMDQLIGFRKAQLGIPNKDWYHGIYGNEGALYLFARYSKERTTKISPSAPLAADFKNITRHEMQLTIHSLNASRCTPVAETILQLFTEGEDIRRIWLEAAKTADQVNLAIAEGIPPTSECDCPSDTASSELHPCEGCGAPTLCFKRVVDSRGRLVCAFCDHTDKNPKSHPAGVSHPNETSIQNRLRVALSANFRNECRTRGSKPDSSANQAILKKATDDILKQLDPTSKTEYTDRYTSLTHDMGLDRGAVGKNPSRRRYVPWMLCPDAAFPEGQPQFDGMKHSAGNLEVTSVVCNMAKYIHLPGVLQVVADFLRLERPSLDDRKKLLKSLSNLTLARLKHRFLRNSTKTSAQQRFDKAREEMIRGEPVAGERGPWEAYSQRYVAHPPPQYDAGKGNSLWSEEAYARLQACARSIATFFGVTPYVLGDETIWFGGRDSNPEGFDRNGVFQLCRERLARMRLECNKKWVTSDTEETIYVEIIFQTCSSMTEKEDLMWLKQKYGDRLGLPLTVFINSPTKFSVAHRTHGYGMLTGWPSATPSDVQERIDNDKKNNMLIESWYVNSAKLDIAEEYYDKVDHILRNSHVDTTRYRPDAPPPEDSGETFTGSFDELENDDDFVGEDFNADAVKGDDTDTGTVVAADDDAEKAPTTPPVGEEEDPVTGDGLQLDPDDDLHESLKRIRGWIRTNDEVGERFEEDPTIVIFLAEAQQFANDGDADRCMRARHAALEKLGLPTG